VSAASLDLRRGAPAAAAMLLVACAAWVGVVAIARTMGVMPGTMGLGMLTFVLMWTLMMSAMMLPSVAPFGYMYSLGIRADRTVRLTAFVGGYLLVWAIAGVPAYAIAALADRIVAGPSAAATAMAAAIFAVCGVYQLTPLKERCLARCRSPLAQLLTYSAYRGRLRDLRVGVSHGAFCLGCCWALMLLLVAVGVMNVVAMVALAALVALEKLSPTGVVVSRIAGLVALALALLVIWMHGLAPGLSPLDAAGGMGM
jgi:predicted metal-binding membrane protein